MMTKVKKAQKGPSWLEVGLGAALSVVLGVVLGVAYLVTKPVQTVKEIPKDAPTGAIYYIEGIRDFNKSVVIEEKRKSLAAGETIAVEEGELNAFIGSLAKPSAPSPKPGDKGAAPADAKMLDTGTLNIRIRAGKIQFAVPVSYNILSVTGSVIVQASGEFVRNGSTYEFVPDTFTAGGCPLVHLPIIKDYVLRKFLFAMPVPEDIASAWGKLAGVSIEGSTLRLKMP